MSLAVERKIATSKQAFLNEVWPAIGFYVGGGEVISCEGSNHPLLKAFDTSCGIDAWQCTDCGMWGLASRVQNCQGKDWGTFTVRQSRLSGYTTEYEKLWTAVNSDDGRVCPFWFVQAYMSSDMSCLLSAAACQTRSILYYIRDNLTTKDLRTNSQDGSTFWPVSWLAMQAAGYTVHVVRPERKESNHAI